METVTPLLVVDEETSAAASGAEDPEPVAV
jgi:hypothetical protein